MIGSRWYGRNSAALAVACVVCWLSCSSDPADKVHDAADAGREASPANDACVAVSCSDQGADCGELSDGCGSSLDCGACAAPLTCGGDGNLNRCGCVPATCVALGKTCGMVSDACGGFLDCGDCSNGENCGGAGVANVCGQGTCTPDTCEAQGKDCGLIADGCGGTIECGSCRAPQSCGGGGLANVCGCTPQSCSALGKDCGMTADGCGGTVDCGGCGASETCGGAGVPNVCGVGSCTPTTCEAKSKNCGTTSDGCSLVLSCGSCSAPETCGGGGVEDVCGVDQLGVASGCAGIYNPDQLLDLHLTMTAGDWQIVQTDTSNSVYVPAQFRCGSEAPLPFNVGLRRKRSGSTLKPGLKLDFNFYDSEAAYQSLKKLSLENGISSGSGDAERKDVITEYLSWRFMVRGGAVSSRAALIRLFVNGSFIGVYTNVEQVDKRFLRSRLGDESGWLYKHSGGDDDGYKTNADQPNPYAEYLCFLDKNGCPVPPSDTLASYLPSHLDIEQMLKFGGINALIANADAPFVKENNYYFYDWHYGPRLYLAWDLDTVMKTSPPLFGAAGSTTYTGLLFTHWEDDYDLLLTDLLAGPLSVAGIDEELDRVADLAAAALDSDPVLGGDSAAAAVEEVRAWWHARHAQLTNELAQHSP